MSSHRICTVVLLSALSLQACAPLVIGAGASAAGLTAADRRTVGVQADDESTEWKVRFGLNQAYKSNSHINATAFNRDVLLTGEVPSDSAKQDVERTVRGIAGVRKIFNDLTVGPESGIPERLNDGFITSKVKARLIEEEHISATHVKVTTERGIAYLMGLATARESRLATELARRTAGVRKVVNLLELLDPPVALVAPVSPGRPAEPTTQGVSPIAAPMVVGTQLN